MLEKFRHNKLVEYNWRFCKIKLQKQKIFEKIFFVWVIFVKNVNKVCQKSKVFSKKDNKFLK